MLLHWKSRFPRAATFFSNGQQCFEQHRARRRQDDLILMDDLEHPIERAAQVEIPERLTAVLVDECRDVSLKGVMIQVRRHRSQSFYDIGHLAGVLLSNGEEQAL